MNATAIYIRTSTEEQTPENQIDDCKTLIEDKKGHYTVFMDKQTAWKDNKERPNFEILKKKIKSRELKNVIVWDLDRIYRSRKKLISFFEECKIYNCKVYSFRQKWLEDLNKIPPPFDEIMFNLMLNIMGWLAEEESTKKSHRVKLAVDRRGKYTKSKYGKKWGRKPISTQKLNKIKSLQHLSIRGIEKETGIPKSVVHKYLTLIKQEKT